MEPENGNLSASRGRCVLVFAGHFLPHVGGVERFSLELWSRVARRGWQVLVVTGNTENVAAREDVDGIQVLRLPVLSFFRRRLPILLPGPVLMRTVRGLAAQRPRLVVTNTRFFSTSILGIAMARWLRIPSLHIEHGSAHVALGGALQDWVGRRFDHTLGAWVVRHADRCVGVSGSVVRFLSHLGRPDAGILHNGVGASAFGGRARGPCRARWGVANDDIVIAFVGRLIEEKGILVLLDAMDRIAQPHFHLVVAGDGDLRGEVARRCMDRPRSHFLGPIPQREVATLMAACDVFVHPSWYPEGLPTAVLEAAVSGCAIIATPAGGTEEIIPTGGHGLLIAPRDPVALAEAIAILGADRERRVRMGNSVKDRACELFDWERITDRAVREIEGLCGE